MNTFAQRSLPPGDRDELPFSPPEEAQEPIVGREPDILPGLTLIIDECGVALEKAQFALAELNHARNHDAVALFKAAARRLASHTNHVARIAARYQPREASQLNQPKE